MSADGAVISAAPLHSPQWFRVSALRPRLDPAVQVRRQWVRGQRWHVLQRSDGLRSVRLNAAAWGLVGRCDGQATLQKLWEWSLRESGDAAPTQDEVLDLVARLQSAGLLSVDRPATWDPAEEAALLPVAAGAADDGPARRSSWLAWRIPLGSPDAFFARTARALRPLGGAFWALLAVLGLSAALLTVLWHGPTLLAQAGALLASPRGAVLAAVLYPVMKLLHEAAHGVMARWHGARVPEWGISLLMFLPVPYVDASAVSALPRARARAAVSAAGIAVEGAAAAAGVLLASQVQPGLLQDLGLMLMVVGALSTFAVNANPLLRFDGYHVLCDLAGLPNLATRSQRWWLQHLQRRLLGVATGALPAAARGERGWLWAYAPAALVMRWTVSVALVLWLAGLSGVAALLAGLALSWGLVVQPLRAGWRAWRRAALPDELRLRARVRLVLFGALPLLLVVAVPWPDRTVAQGVWWLPETALVRTEVDGFVAEVLAEDGQTVAAGDVLLRLRAPTVEAEAAQWRARLAALQTEHWQALTEDPPRAARLEHEIGAARAAVIRAQELLEQRAVRAGVSGRLALPRADDLTGRWLPRGELLAHVVTGEPGIVRVAIPHERAALVAQAAPAVDLRRASAPDVPLAGQWPGFLGGAAERLPSAALGERSGGALPVDPADAAGTRATQRVVLADVRPGPAGPDADAQRIGERVWVRFDHGVAPLAWQAARAMQQLILRHLGSGA